MNQKTVFDLLIGTKLDSIELNSAKDILTIKLADGTERRYQVEGDCCSSSWIEHLELPGDIKGATVLGGDEQCMEDPTSTEDTCLKVYCTILKTDRGDVVFEYRNSSNGYYGGYIVEISLS